VVGDSLVHSSQTGGGIDATDPDRHIDDAAAARGLRASVSAIVGADTADLGGLAGFPAPGPDALVIALGTNDMRDGVVPVDTAIRNLVAAIDRIGAPCTAVVTIIDEPTWGLDVTAPPYNAALAALAEARDDVVLADWAGVADAHPEHLQTDGVHLTEEGKAAYRDLLLDGAEACLALHPPVTTTTDPGPTTTSQPGSTTTTPEPEPTTTTTATTTEPEATTTTGPGWPTTTTEVTGP
jgi:lysophospholipase L1-like esterase